MTDKKVNTFSEMRFTGPALEGARPRERKGRKGLRVRRLFDAGPLRVVTLCAVLVIPVLALIALTPHDPVVPEQTASPSDAAADIAPGAPPSPDLEFTPMAPPADVDLGPVAPPPPPRTTVPPNTESTASQPTTGTQSPTSQPTSTQPLEAGPPSTSTPPAKSAGPTTTARDQAPATASSSAAPTPTTSTAPAASQRHTRSYEAEAAINSERGGARLLSCTRCSAGKKMGYIGTDENVDGGTLRFNQIHAERSGTASMTIVYVNGESSDRLATVTVNGKQIGWLRCPTSGDWQVPRAVTIELPLKAGKNTIMFANPKDSAPDLDRIIVVTG